MGSPNGARRVSRTATPGSKPSAISRASGPPRRVPGQSHRSGPLLADRGGAWAIFKKVRERDTISIPNSIDITLPPQAARYGITGFDPLTKICPAPVSDDTGGRCFSPAPCPSRLLRRTSPKFCSSPAPGSGALPPRPPTNDRAFGFQERHLRWGQIVRDLHGQVLHIAG